MRYFAIICLGILNFLSACTKSNTIQSGQWQVETSQNLIMNLPEGRIANLPQQPRVGSICVSEDETLEAFIKRIAQEGNECELRSFSRINDEITLKLSCSVSEGRVDSETRYVFKNNGKEIEGTSEVVGEVNGFKVTGTATYSQVWEKSVCDE